MRRPNALWNVARRVRSKPRARLCPWTAIMFRRALSMLRHLWHSRSSDTGSILLLVVRPKTTVYIHRSRWQHSRPWKSQPSQRTQQCLISIPCCKWQSCSKTNADTSLAWHSPHSCTLITIVVVGQVVASKMRLSISWAPCYFKTEVKFSVTESSSIGWNWKVTEGDVII